MITANNATLDPPPPPPHLARQKDSVLMFAKRMQILSCLCKHLQCLQVILPALADLLLCALSYRVSFRLFESLSVDSPSSILWLASLSATADGSDCRQDGLYPFFDCLSIVVVVVCLSVYLAAVVW